MKTCTKCVTPKPLDEFVQDKRRADGRGSWCLGCTRIYAKTLYQRSDQKAAKQQYYIENKTELNAQSRQRWVKNKVRYKVAADKWSEANRDFMLSYYRLRGSEHRASLDLLKGAKPCLDCGGVFPPFCMEYDHVRGDKRFALGKMSNHRQEAVLEEIEKCELVCCACHRIRTQSRNTHGAHKGKHAAWSKSRLLAFREWLNTLKGNPCLDCGKVLHPVAMDFDHVRGEKVNSISSMWSWGRDRVLAEIDKCELVCANCHRVRTQSRRVGGKVNSTEPVNNRSMVETQ